MICKPCTDGDHCGLPGQPNQHCPCQHLAPGTGQTVCQYACTHPQGVHLPGRGCTVPRCHCLWKAQEQGQPVPLAPSGGPQDTQDPPAPVRESQPRVRDLDLQAYLKRRRPNG